MKAGFATALCSAFWLAQLGNFGCSQGTVACEPSTIFLHLRCAIDAPAFSGAQLEVVRDDDGKAFAQTIVIECPGVGVKVGIKVPGYKAGNSFSLKFTPAGSPGLTTAAHIVAEGECVSWDVLVPHPREPVVNADGGNISLNDGGSDAFNDMVDGGPDNLRSKENGSTCSSSNECLHGICADGVCCESLCAGPCSSCNETGSLGFCLPKPRGQRPTLPKSCATTPASTCGLDGACDGEGSCAKYTDGSVCEPGKCSGATIVDRKTCKQGVCTAAVDTVCAPFQCDSTVGKCFSKCLNSSECASGQSCDGANSCGKKLDGATCTLSSECLNGKCADGFCCDGACSGQCEACNLPGKEGQCIPVPKGTKDPKNLCKADGVATCGQTGSCDGARGCSVYEANTVCRSAGCQSNVTLTSGACNGSGLCVGGPSITCMGATPACVAGKCLACSPGDVSTCGAKLGAKGTCGSGTTVCDGTGNWGACSVVAAAKDTCVAGNDDDCNGTHTACVCGGFIMPNSTSAGLPNPAAYDVSNPGIVVDNVSKLMWEQPVGTTIYPTDGFSQAVSYCTALRLGGYSDWRLPTRVELSSIIDETRTAPAVNPNAFAGTPFAAPTAYYWTSSSVAATGGQLRIISFGAGGSSVTSSSTMQRLRCVRQPSPQCYRTRFEVGALGTVFDASTELTWKQSFSDTGLTRSNAISYCENLGSGYRLPSAKELITLLDEQYTLPTVDLKFFPNTPNECFWSSTSLSGTQVDGWGIDFGTGRSTQYPGTSLCRARCVH